MSDSLGLRLLRSPLGDLIARPWLDRLAARLLRRRYLPLFRQWAAANLSGVDENAFIDSVGAGRIVFGKAEIRQILSDVTMARRRRAIAEARWEDCFFGRGAAAPGLMATIENERLLAAHAHNMTFRRFTRLRYRRAVPAVDWDIRRPEEALAELGGEVALDSAHTYPMPGDVPIVASPPLDNGLGRHFWVSFRSPSPWLSDYVTAWVQEPRGVVNPPTLIYGHGLGVDFDHWQGARQDTDHFVRAGIRVIRPEAPWHGRRTVRGRYPGETFAALGPLGAIMGLASAVHEWAVLLRWARATSTGPVAIGGISLGAMTAQLVAAKARYWPEEFWPDALFLITHCASIGHAIRQGEIVDIWRGREEITSAGWTIDAMLPFLGLVDPWEEPTVEPGQVVVLNGFFDRIMPYVSAEHLLTRWEVPYRNRFIWPRGHFSVPIGMIRDSRPADRFIQIMHDLRDALR